MGVPVVATRVSAIPEIITPGETGLLVEPGRPDQMASAMLQGLQDHDLRRKVIAAGRQRVQESFDNVALVDELVQIHRAQLQKAWTQRRGARRVRPARA